jgi:hypothetical protein
MRIHDMENWQWLKEFGFDTRDRHSLSAMDIYEFGVGELRWDVCP